MPKPKELWVVTAGSCELDPTGKAALWWYLFECLELPLCWAPQGQPGCPAGSQVGKESQWQLEWETMHKSLEAGASWKR